MNYKEMPEYRNQLEIAAKYEDNKDVSGAISQIDDIITDSIRTLKAAENAPILKALVDRFKALPEVRKDLIQYSCNLIAVLQAAVTAELKARKQAPHEGGNHATT
jgi:hypothetical protein